MDGVGPSLSLRRAAAVVVTLAVLVALAGFLYDSREQIAASWSLRPEAMLAVGALTLAILAVRGWANKLHFAPLGVAASAGDWFRLVTVTSFTNYLPLSAGLFAKAFFLKRVHDVPYARFAVGQTTLLLLVIATNGAAGLAALALGFREHLTGPVGLAFALMLAVALLFFLPERLRAALSGRFFPWDEHAGSAALRHWPAVAACQLLILAAAGSALFLCFAMAAQPAGFFACVVFSAAAVITRFVTIVPGALGVREFLIGGLALLTGFDLTDAVVAATLTRAVEIAIVAVLGGVFTFTLSHQLGR